MTRVRLPRQLFRMILVFSVSLVRQEVRSLTLFELNSQNFMNVSPKRIWPMSEKKYIFLPFSDPHQWMLIVSYPDVSLTLCIYNIWQKCWHSSHMNIQHKTKPSTKFLQTSQVFSSSIIYFFCNQVKEIQNESTKIGFNFHLYKTCLFQPFLCMLSDSK